MKELLEVGHVIKVGKKFGIIMPNDAFLNSNYIECECGDDRYNQMIVSYFAYENEEHNGWDRISVIVNQITKIFKVSKSNFGTLSFNDVDEINLLKLNQFNSYRTIKCLYSEVIKKWYVFNDNNYLLSEKEIEMVHEILKIKEVKV